MPRRRYSAEFKREAVALAAQPGKPTQNAFVESFNAKFRDYCLDLNRFASIQGARSTIESWRTHYNPLRSHRSQGKKPPAVFAQAAA
jgi:putative transposase